MRLVSRTGLGKRDVKNQIITTRYTPFNVMPVLATHIYNAGRPL